MVELLEKYIVIKSEQELLAILRAPGFAGSLTKNRAPNGSYFFRLRNGRMTVGRSKNFDTKAERDLILREFIDTVEVKLHQNLQRSFDFT